MKSLMKTLKKLKMPPPFHKDKGKIDAEANTTKKLTYRNK
jgi:hypothetical protein